MDAIPPAETGDSKMPLPPVPVPAPAEGRDEPPTGAAPLPLGLGEAPPTAPPDWGWGLPATPAAPEVTPLLPVLLAGAGAPGADPEDVLLGAAVVLLDGAEVGDGDGEGEGEVPAACCWDPV